MRQQVSQLDPTLPMSLRGLARTHEAPEPAPAVTVEVVPRLRLAQAVSLTVVMPVPFDDPRVAARRGFVGRAAPGPGPPQLTTGHSVLRV
jgi:hypothetical protein